MTSTNSISDDSYLSHENNPNNSLGVNTGGCVTPTNQSKPIYSHIKIFSSENDNITNVVDVSKAIIHSTSLLSLNGSLNSSNEDAAELDKLIKFHAVTDKKEKCDRIPYSSSSDIDNCSEISWLSPKKSSAQSVLHQGLKYFSDDGTRKDIVKHVRNVSRKGDETRNDIGETPKRIVLKTLDNCKKHKRKPIRLANLPRIIHTRDNDEIKIVKQDIKIIEPNCDNETFDINKYLAKTRRKLSFPMEDFDYKASSSSISSKSQQEGSNIETFSSEEVKLKRQADIEDKDSNIKTASSKEDKLKRQANIEDKEPLKQLSKLLEESDGKFLIDDYLSKLKGIAAKSPTTRRAKTFEQGTMPKTYFDFDDYCMKLLRLREKFTEK